MIGRKPSISVRTVSSRVSSALMPPATTPRPLPRMVIVTRSPAASDSSCSFAALHLRRSVSRWRERQLRRAAVGQLLLDQRGQRQIEVVAAEQQVLADRDPLEAELVALGVAPASG